MTADTMAVRKKSRTVLCAYFDVGGEESRITTTMQRTTAAES
jgi:hypothetical protein